MKYKSGLYQEYTEKKKKEEEQNRLQIKYNVDPTVKVVEKTNMAMFLITTIGNIVRWIARIIIFILAGIGLISLIYPSARAELLLVFDDILLQLKQYI